ncbi:MAG: hypothetical protein ACYTFH_04375, partial [Planctomycetota bacterium]
MSRHLPLLLVLAALLGLAAAAGMLSVPARSGEPGVLGEAITSPPRGLRDLVLGLGVLVLGAWIFGELLSVIRLPRICGYLLFGVLVGPDAATWRPEWFPNVLGGEQLAYVKLVDGLAIAVIAFVAGGEIRLGELRKIAGKVAGVVGLHAVVGHGDGRLLRGAADGAGTRRRGRRGPRPRAGARRRDDRDGDLAGGAHRGHQGRPR